jgi:hypothetical protein
MCFRREAIKIGSCRLCGQELRPTQINYLCSYDEHGFHSEIHCRRCQILLYAWATQSVRDHPRIALLPGRLLVWQCDDNDRRLRKGFEKVCSGLKADLRLAIDFDYHARHTQELRKFEAKMLAKEAEGVIFNASEQIVQFKAGLENLQHDMTTQLMQTAAEYVVHKLDTASQTEKLDFS